MIKLLSVSLLAFLLSTNLNFGQGNQSVMWLIKADLISKNEMIFTAKASIAPSWHLYSQYIKEGGPRPTKCIFEDNSDYVRIGRIEEKGRQTKFYDDIYEMDIVWYSNEVSFLQRVKLNRTVTVIKGKVEYMTCNNAVCIPDMQEFSINVRSLIKNPILALRYFHSMIFFTSSSVK